MISGFIETEADVDLFPCFVLSDYAIKMSPWGPAILKQETIQKAFIPQR